MLHAHSLAVVVKHRVVQENSYGGLCHAGTAANQIVVYFGDFAKRLNDASDWEPKLDGPRNRDNGDLVSR